MKWPICRILTFVLFGCLLGEAGEVMAAYEIYTKAELASGDLDRLNSRCMRPLVARIEAKFGKSIPIIFSEEYSQHITIKPTSSDYSPMELYNLSYGKKTSDERFYLKHIEDKVQEHALLLERVQFAITGINSKFGADNFIVIELKPIFAKDLTAKEIAYLKAYVIPADPHLSLAKIKGKERGKAGGLKQFLYFYAHKQLESCLRGEALIGTSVSATTLRVIYQPAKGKPWATLAKSRPPVVLPAPKPKHHRHHHHRHHGGGNSNANCERRVAPWGTKAA